MNLKQILDDHKLWQESRGGKRADLSAANLGWANLREADLRRADLRGADLRRADLRGADLREADLCEATLCGANLYKANLRRADLRRADLSGAKRGGCTLKDLITSTNRSDGYTFLLWNTLEGWRVEAGCRWFTFENAQKHWRATRGGTPLGLETRDILRFFRARAKSRP